MRKALQRLAETLGPLDETGAGWAGYAAPLGVPNYRQGPQPFPYRTRTAEMVWEAAKKLVPMHPELDEIAILKKAVEVAAINTLDMTPEDWRLLEMAIEYYKSGTTGIATPRTASSGPENSNAYGQEVANRSGLP
jgi:hypothetical protein